MRLVVIRMSVDDDYPRIDGIGIAFQQLEDTRLIFTDLRITERQPNRSLDLGQGLFDGSRLGQSLSQIA